MGYGKAALRAQVRRGGKGGGGDPKTEVLSGGQTKSLEGRRAGGVPDQMKRRLVKGEEREPSSQGKRETSTESPPTSKSRYWGSKRMSKIARQAPQGNRGRE